MVHRSVVHQPQSHFDEKQRTVEVHLWISAETSMYNLRLIYPVPSQSTAEAIADLVKQVEQDKAQLECSGGISVRRL